MEEVGGLLGGDGGMRMGQKRGGKQYLVSNFVTV